MRASSALSRSLIGVVLLGLAAICGCNKQEAKQTGTEAQKAAQTTGTILDKGLNKVGVAANKGIRAANQEALEAKPVLRAAGTQAARDIGNGAQTAGHLADRAGHAIHRELVPATQPAR